MKKKTLVLGATTNRTRYAFAAVRRLKAHGYEVVPLGIRKGEIDGIEILTGQPELEDIHTITLYINPMRQEAYYDYLLDLKPARIIFNPGTENQAFMRRAMLEGVEVEIGCTLVMLSMNQY